MGNLKWTLTSIVGTIVPGETISSWRKRCPLAYNAAHKNDWMPEMSHLLTRIQHRNGYWNKDRVLKSANRYRSRQEWKRGCVSSYNAARRNGWLEEASLSLNPKSNEKWTKEEILSIANKYDKLSQWIKNDLRSYYAAKRLGIFDEVSVGMQKSYSKSLAEIELYGQISLTYPEAVSGKKFKAKKIQREVDIFIPSVKKGIEFDGKYWHGKGFKRKGFSSAHEYHAHKDLFLLNNFNIKILHIKEEDWIKDKDRQIDLAISFLKGGSNGAA